MQQVNALDHLTRDVLAAEAADMSYGKWKALHPCTAEWDEIDADSIGVKAQSTIVCQGCGKTFIPPDGRANRKYCGDACRKREAERRYREAHPIRNLNCIVCGKLMTGRAGKMYCSDACSLRGYRQKAASRRESGEVERMEY